MEQTEKNTYSGEEGLLAIYVKNDCDWNKTYQDLVEKKMATNKEIEKILSSLEESGIKYITILNKRYPAQLKATFKPPFVLFYKGNLSLLSSDNIVSVSGSKQETNMDTTIGKYLNEINKDKNNQLTYIVNGTSYVSSLIESKNIICVMPFNYKPEEIEKVLANGGLCLSETLSTTPIDSEILAFRNRIISGIASRLIVSSAKKQSSTLMLINFFLQNNKPIFVAPTNFEDSKEYINNKLIYEGAYSFFDKESLLDSLTGNYTGC